MKYFLLLTYFLFSINGLLAQGIIVTKGDESSGVNLRGTEIQRLQTAKSELIDLTVNVDGARINQIGNNNKLDLTTISNSSGITIDQIGDDNRTLLFLRGEQIDYSVLQQGNNNLLLEYNNNPDKQLLQREVNQIGNRQNLIIHGQNDIVDRMKITMRGSQSVIIRNTN